MVMLTISSVQIFLLGLFRTQFECDVSPALRKGNKVLVVKTNKQTKTPKPSKKQTKKKKRGEEQ